MRDEEEREGGMSMRGWVGAFERDIALDLISGHCIGWVSSHAYIPNRFDCICLCSKSERHGS